MHMKAPCAACLVDKQRISSCPKAFKNSKSNLKVQFSLQPRDVLMLNQHYNQDRQSLLALFWYMIPEQLLFVFVKI